MKTPLQKQLVKVAPSIHIETIWEHDPDCEREFKELSRNPGDCFHGEDRDDWEPWQSEIRATAIINGELVSGSAYLGGTWEQAGDNPWKSNPEISGYESQMTVEALKELATQIGEVMGEMPILNEIGGAIAHINSQI